ncbi:MAG: ftsH, partial [Phenylobacterium sp.]|nr:ftsH [Phenylobacterium sp.]
MNLRNLVIWGIVVVALIGIYSMVTGGGHAAGASEISYSQLLSKVDSGDVKSAMFRGSAVESQDNANKTFTAVTQNNQDDLAKSMKA